ncbi:hypothetical protein [Streptomyces sp. NPDC002588]|uniref:hypothetical protein n=1 Tax=Streptomyces sp. NPDC002588 TaxID=3154419 RepID=UPI00332DAFBF
MLDLFRAVMTDDEITAAGAEYRAAVTDLNGDVPLLPTTVTTKPLSEAFGVSDLKAHLPAMAEANRGRANCTAVNVGAMAEGQAIDSPAFKAAVDDVGFGTSVLIGPPPDGTTPVISPFNAKFEFENFLCRREVGDGLSGRDEVYFTAAARSDKHTQEPAYQSDEFEKVEQGDVRPFRSDQRLVFGGPAGAFVLVVVQVWEADHSPDEFYDKLMMALEAWLDQPFWVDLTLEILTAMSGVGGTIIGVIDSIIQVFVSLKECLREFFNNADDLSCERALLFDRHAMATLYHRKDTEWEFNGDGHHSLRVKYTGERPVLPTGTVQYVAMRADKVSAPVSLGWKSASPPTLAVFENQLRCFYTRPADDAVMWSTRDTHGVWSPPQPIGNWASIYKLTPAVFQNKLFMAHVGLDGTVWIAHYTRSNGWSQTTRIPEIQTSQAVALAADATWMYLMHRAADPGRSDLFWQSSTNGSAWTAAEWNNWQSLRAPSLAASGQSQWLVSLGTDGKNYVGKRPGSGRFNTKHIWSWGNDEAPTVVTTSNLWVAARADNGDIKFIKRGSTDDQWIEVTGAQVGAMPGEVALAYHDEALYAMYRR